MVRMKIILISLKIFYKIIKNMNNLSVIMVGDWNVVLDYEKDHLNYKHKNNPKAKKHIQEIMTHLNLVDIWREKHENHMDRTT